MWTQNKWIQVWVYTSLTIILLFFYNNFAILFPGVNSNQMDPGVSIHKFYNDPGKLSVTNRCCSETKEVLDSRVNNFFNNGGEEFVGKSTHFSEISLSFEWGKKSTSVERWKTEMEDWFTIHERNRKIGFYKWWRWLMRQTLHFPYSVTDTCFKRGGSFKLVGSWRFRGKWIRRCNDEEWGSTKKKMKG